MQSSDTDNDSAPARLGRKLREARLAAGYRSQQSFGDVINLHRTTVTKIESGHRHINVDVLRRWCEICAVDYELYEASARLAWVTEAAPVPDWFADFMKALIIAHTIRAWNPIIIPGLLQTADYARVLYEATGTPDDLIEERVNARIDLQRKTLDRVPVPVTLLAVIDEAVLHRQVGTPEIMRAQLLHLAEMGQRKNVGIQVIPASRGANAGPGGAFTIASLDDADVLLKDGVDEDLVTDKRSSVRAAIGIFDRVRLAALSGPESIELITKVAEQCNP
jgi:transcriptional regulator with XRE-family HTH domain